MKQLYKKHLDKIIRITVVVGVVAAIAGGYYAYYVNQILR
jgi:hypothetical protein